MKKFKTNVNIDNDKAPNDDLQFIRSRGFKPTNLLRAKIKELRAIEEGEPSQKQLLENMKNLQDRLKSVLSYLEQKGLLDEFLKI